jgi:hypothetical protein
LKFTQEEEASPEGNLVINLDLFLDYENFARILDIFFEESFQDLFLDHEDNVILTLFKHSLETIHTMNQNYQVLQQIIRGCFKVQSTVSVQYLIFSYKKGKRVFKKIKQ